MFDMGSFIPCMGRVHNFLALGSNLIDDYDIESNAPHASDKFKQNKNWLP